MENENQTSPIVPEENQEPQDEPQESPSKSPDTNEPLLPLCTGCMEDLEAIRFVDYGDIRVVLHTRNRCVIGVVKNS